MRKTFIPAIFLLIIFIGCQEQKSEAQSKLNEASLNSLVLKAVSGIKSANDSLSGLFDLNLPDNKYYNNLTINNLELPSGEKMFFVLLEYPNPVYNRFAVYNENLKSFLIDKSLNGQLSQKLIKINGKDFIEVNEGFLSKDVIQMSRISIYGITDNDVSLVFRDFTKIKMPKREYSQTIKKFSDNQIETEIDGTRRGYEPKQDLFVFNEKNKTYESKINMFNSLVNYLINNFDHKAKNPQITDPQSAEISVKKPS